MLRLWGDGANSILVTLSSWEKKYFNSFKRCNN